MDSVTLPVKDSNVRMLVPIEISNRRDSIPRKSLRRRWQKGKTAGAITEQYTYRFPAPALAPPTRMSQAFVTVEIRQKQCCEADSVRIEFTRRVGGEPHRLGSQSQAMCGVQCVASAFGVADRDALAAAGLRSGWEVHLSWFGERTVIGAQACPILVVDID